MNDYLLLLVAVVLPAFDFALNKIYGQKAGSSLSAGLFFNALCGFFTAIIFFFIGGMHFGVSAYSITLATVMAVLSLAYNVIGFRILKSGTVSEYSMFLMTGGMTVPVPVKKRRKIWNF